MAEGADRPRELLTSRLARLGMSLRDNENKILIAEAVEALHEAAEGMQAAPDQTHSLASRRHVNEEGAHPTMETKCEFELATRLCSEHSGHYLGNQTCSNKRKGDRLDAKIAKLEAKRDALRNYWKRQP